jgi:tRNA 2-thiouridine synthesizing protein A
MSSPAGPQDQTALLDLSGLFCPEVVLRVASHVKTMTPGARLEIVSTDPLSAIDVPLFGLRGGHDVQKRIDADGRQHFLLTVGPRG